MKRRIPFITAATIGATGLILAAVGIAIADTPPTPAFPPPFPTGVGGPVDQKPVPTILPADLPAVKEDRAKVEQLRKDLTELIANESNAATSELKAGIVKARADTESAIRGIEDRIERVKYFAEHPPTAEERAARDREFAATVVAHETAVANLANEQYLLRKATGLAAGNGHIMPKDPEIQSEGYPSVEAKDFRIWNMWVKDLGPNANVAVIAGYIFAAPSRIGQVPDRSQGAVMVTGWNVPREFKKDIYRTASKSGALTAISARGDTVEFLAEDGTHFFFDLGRMAFVGR